MVLCTVVVFMAGVLFAASAAASSPATVMGWGLNEFGQLGNGSLTGPSTCEGSLACALAPVPASLSLPAGVTVTQVAGGNEFSLALLSDAKIMAWGDDGAGQLGDASTFTSDVPVPVSLTLSSGTTVRAIAAGGIHGLALLSNDKIMAWGDNAYGQLGDGSTTSSDVPVPVTLPLPPDTTVKAIAGGFLDSFALLSNNTIMAWGTNQYGELGDDTYTGPSTCSSTACSTTPVAVDLPPLPAGVTVTAIAAGVFNSMALLSDGEVLTWGYNENGQLGNGTWGVAASCGGPCSSVPVVADITPPSGVRATSIAAGGYQDLALLSDGELLTWGYNEDGQLGDGTSAGPMSCGGASCSTTPVAVDIAPSPGVTVTAIAAGVWHSIALLSDGEVMTWGENQFGQLGDGTATGPSTCISGSVCSATPVNVLLTVPPADTVTAIAAGGFHNLALLSESGPPEFGRCIQFLPEPGPLLGKYGNSNCTTAGGGKEYEWYPGVIKAHFTTTLTSGTIKLQPISGTLVKCSGETGEGEYTEPKAVGGVTLRFTGCKRAATTCASASGGPGEIVTHPLNGALGVYQAGTSSLTNKIGLDLYPVGPGGAGAGVVAKFTCASGSSSTAVSVQGSVIVPIESNKMLLDNKLKAKETSGHQKPEGFLAEPADYLEQALSGGSSFLQTGLDASITQVNEEEVEVDSVA